MVVATTIYCCWWWWKMMQTFRNQIDSNSLFRSAKMNFLILISKRKTTFGYCLVLLGEIFTFSLLYMEKFFNQQQSHTIPIHTQTHRHRQWHWNCLSVIATLLFSFIALIVFDWIWVFILMRLIQWAWNVWWALLYQTFLQLLLLSFDHNRWLMSRERANDRTSDWSDSIKYKHFIVFK